MNPRTVIFEIRPEDMIKIVLGVKRLVIPDGAKIVRWWQDVFWRDARQEGEAFYVRVEHESYAEVEPGRKAPRLAAEFAELRKPAASDQSPRVRIVAGGRR
jgi:hypothetical protein